MICFANFIHYRNLAAQSRAVHRELFVFTISEMFGHSGLSNSSRRGCNSHADYFYTVTHKIKRGKERDRGRNSVCHTRTADSYSHCMYNVFILMVGEELHRNPLYRREKFTSSSRLFFSHECIQFLPLHMSTVSTAFTLPLSCNASCLFS